MSEGGEIRAPHSDGARTEKAYSELRVRSLLAAGCPARLRPIFKLSCRFDDPLRVARGRSSGCCYGL
jgi:hypothetical protein